MHTFILHLFDYCNAVILLYFIVTNLVYMVLMLICLYTVTLHSKFSSRTAVAEYLDSPVTPPVALLVPAFNEQDAVISTVVSLMQLNYPEKEIIVIDDGSTDRTLPNLIEHFQLLPMDFIYRPTLACKSPDAFYYSHRYPELLVISKQNGGKSDALNCGINMSRSPYFCTVDADTVIERDALVRDMDRTLSDRGIHPHVHVRAPWVEFTECDVHRFRRILPPASRERDWCRWV